MCKLASRQAAPAENFTGIYKGTMSLLETGGETFKQLEGECSCMINHDKHGNGTANIYLAGESIGNSVPAAISQYALTLHGTLWSSAFEWQGTFCFKNRVMALTGSGILEDTNTKIKLDLVMVDEWKRPLSK